MRSGSVKHFHTSSRGASSSREMTKSGLFVVVAIGHSYSIGIAGFGLVRRLVRAQGDESTQPIVTKVESTPHQQAEIKPEQCVGEDRIAEPQVACNRSAQIAGQQDRADYGGSRCCVEYGANEAEN